MTTSTPRTDDERNATKASRLRDTPVKRDAAKLLSDRRGFTLTEVIVAATLSAFVLAGVLSTFLMMGRTGANMANYAQLEAEARKALDLFGQDVRMAKNVNWGGVLPSSATSVTLTIPPPATGGSDWEVTYYLDTVVSSPTYRSFIRRVGPASVSNPGTVLIRKVSNFSYQAYKVGSTGIASNPAETKQIQLSLTASRASTTVVTATDVVLSARFILRNKSVTT